MKTGWLLAGNEELRNCSALLQHGDRPALAGGSKEEPAPP